MRPAGGRIDARGPGSFDRADTALQPDQPHRHALQCIVGDFLKFELHAGATPDPLLA